MYTNFRKGKLSMCPFETECAGLRYAVKKENHYLVACPKVLVITDCKSLGSTHAKPLENIANRRIQKMLLDVAHINLTFKHVPGIKNCTTDFWSRQPRDSWEAVTEDDCQVRLRLGIRSVQAQERDLEPVDARLEVMAQNALSDTDYQTMINHIVNDTPLEKWRRPVSCSKWGVRGNIFVSGIVKMGVSLWSRIVRK